MSQGTRAYEMANTGRCTLQHSFKRGVHLAIDFDAVECGKAKELLYS